MSRMATVTFDDSSKTARTRWNLEECKYFSNGIN